MPPPRGVSPCPPASAGAQETGAFSSPFLQWLQLQNTGLPLRKKPPWSSTYCVPGLRWHFLLPSHSVLASAGGNGVMSIPRMGKQRLREGLTYPRSHSCPVGRPEAVWEAGCKGPAFPSETPPSPPHRFTLPYGSSGSPSSCSGAFLVFCFLNPVVKSPEGKGPPQPRVWSKKL